MQLTTHNSALDLIKGSAILEDSDWKTLMELNEELVDVFKTVQVFRTESEMRLSVLNEVKHPTPDAKYWQAVREQNVMFNELVILSYDYRKEVIEIKKLQRKLEKETDDLEQELLRIEIEKKQFLNKSSERVAKDRIRELRQWHKIKEELKPEMKYSLSDVNEHQMESLTKRFENQVAVMGEHGSPSENINLIGNLITAQKYGRKLE